MDKLLTSRDVQRLLKVDRVTIYRMLNDGRLNGVKIGGQWRFSQREIESLLSVAAPAEEPDVQVSSAEAIPVVCAQAVQDLFSDITGIGLITIFPDGTPVTDFSSGCQLCRLIQSSLSGREACVGFWRDSTKKYTEVSGFIPCHAGLQVVAVPIKADGATIAMLFAGGVYLSPPNSADTALRAENLAQEYNLNRQQVVAAIEVIPVLDAQAQINLNRWLEKTARIIEAAGQERVQFTDRLQRIAALTNIAGD